MNEKEWTRKINKLHVTLQLMEETKYLEPHFSESFPRLANYCRSFHETASALSNLPSLE